MENSAHIAIIIKEGEIDHTQLKISDDLDLFIERRKQESVEYYQLYYPSLWQRYYK